MRGKTMRHIRALEEHNRGLKKRLKAMEKASIKNHNGLMYWKNIAKDLTLGAALFKGFLDKRNIPSLSLNPPQNLNKEN